MTHHDGVTDEQLRELRDAASAHRERCSRAHRRRGATGDIEHVCETAMTAVAPDLRERCRQRAAALLAIRPAIEAAWAHDRLVICAVYASTCALCNEPIAVGSWVAWKHNRRTAHVVCFARSIR